MPVPFTTDDSTRLQDTLERVVADGAAPGGVIAYGTTDGSPGSSAPAQSLPSAATPPRAGTLCTTSPR